MRWQPESNDSWSASIQEMALRDFLADSDRPCGTDQSARGLMDAHSTAAFTLDSPSPGRAGLVGRESAFRMIDSEPSPTAGKYDGRGGDNEYQTRLAPRSAVAFVMSEDGQDLVEYALIVALLALSVVASMQSFTSKVGNEFNSLESYI
jgi:Flp pilus assembly pilin Flp